jgi:hypothetical protein
VGVGGWKEAIERALGMKPGEVMKLRAAVIETRDNYLLPEAAGRNWLNKLGLSPTASRRAQAIPCAA